jgi:hypothetical protein
MERLEKIRNTNTAATISVDSEQYVFDDQSPTLIRNQEVDLLQSLVIKY